MQDPSFSEMALNQAFECINAAQKSLVDDKAFKQSSKSNLLNRSLSGVLGKNSNQKSTSSLTDHNMESQNSYSHNHDVIDNSKPDNKSSQIETDLEAKQTFSDRVENSDATKGISLDDGVNKSELASQNADEPIAQGMSAVSTSQEQLPKEISASRSGNRAVTTPLLMEKKKVLQDKKAITEEKIKQAKRISPAEIQSKKSVLEEKKNIKNVRIKELSSIKSPELQVKKELINKKAKKSAKSKEKMAGECKICKN